MSGFFISVKTAITNAITEIKAFFYESLGASRLGANSYQTQDDVNLESVSVKRHGAACDYYLADGSINPTPTDDTAAVQAAIDSIVTGGTVNIPGMCLTTAPLTMPRQKFVKLQAQGYGTGITNNTGNVFKVDQEWYVTFADMQLVAGATAGHIFSFETKIPAASYTGISGSRFSNLFIEVLNPTKSVINCNAVNGLYIDNLWDNFNIRNVIGKTAHSFDFREAGGMVGANKWFRGRITYGTTQAFRFESLSTNGYLYDNSLENINFEVVNGGMVKGIGVSSLTTNECYLYDVSSTGGTVDDHMIYLDRVAGGVLSRFVNIKNTFRRSSNLNAGINDIHCVAGGVSGLHVENCSPATVSGFTVELNSAQNVILIGLPTSSIIRNISGTTTVINGGSVGIGVPADTTKSTLCISQGVTFPALQVASSDPNTLDDYRRGSFIGTLTGCTTAPTGIIEYVRSGNMVTLNIPVISGISNTTSATLTGMPAALTPLAQRTALGRIENNTATVAGMVRVEMSGTITLFSSVAGSAFTASGSKGVNSFNASYIL